MFHARQGVLENDAKRVYDEGPSTALGSRGAVASTLNLENGARGGHRKARVGITINYHSIANCN